MKKTLKITQFLFYVFFLCNCTHSIKEKSVWMGILKHNTIDLGDDFIGFGGPLTINQDRMIGLEVGSSLNPLFCYTPSHGTPTFYRFGSKGQGPDDFLYPFSIQHINHETIGVWDMSKRSYCELKIPNENESVEIDQSIRFEFQLSKIIKTAYDQYIALSMEDELFIISDSTGSNLHSFFEYPYQNNHERQLFENRYRSFAYQGTLAVNPSKTKFAFSTINGEIIHFYEIEKNNIKPVAIIEKKYPLYQKNPEQNQTGVIYSSKGINGYVSSYATEQFVYALYNGHKAGDRIYDAKILRVFDWNGILVKEYELDVPSWFICVSDDDSKLWSISSNPDNELVYFDLEESPQNNSDKIKNDIVNSVITSSNDTVVNQTGINNRVIASSNDTVVIQTSTNNSIITFPVNLDKVQVNE